MAANGDIDTLRCAAAASCFSRAACCSQPVLSGGLQQLRSPAPSPPRRKVARLLPTYPQAPSCRGTVNGCARDSRGGTEVASNASTGTRSAVPAYSSLDNGSLPLSMLPTLDESRQSLLLVAVRPAVLPGRTCPPAPAPSPLLPNHFCCYLTS